MVSKVYTALDSTACSASNLTHLESVWGHVVERLLVPILAGMTQKHLHVAVIEGGCQS